MPSYKFEGLTPGATASIRRIGGGATSAEVDTGTVEADGTLVIELDPGNYEAKAGRSTAYAVADNPKNEQERRLELDPDITDEEADSGPLAFGEDRRLRPQESAASVPVPEAGDAGKLLSVTDAEDGYELVDAPEGSAPVGLGHYVDYSNYTDLALEITPEAPLVPVLADINAGDTTLDPASGNALAMAVDGTVPLPEGGTYWVYVFANADFDTPPTADVGFNVGPAFSGTGARVLVLQASDVNITLPALLSLPNTQQVGMVGDDSSTSLYASLKLVVQVAGADAAVALEVLVSGGTPPDATLTNFELQVYRAA